MRAELKKKLILRLVFCPNTCFRIVFSFWMRNELALTTTERLSSSIITISQCHVPGCILFLLTSIVTLIIEPNWRSFYGNNALHSRASILFTESARTPTKPYPKQSKEHDIGHCNGKVRWVITNSFSSRWYGSWCKSGSCLKVQLWFFSFQPSDYHMVVGLQRDSHEPRLVAVLMHEFAKLPESWSYIAHAMRQLYILIIRARHKFNFQGH